MSTWMGQAKMRMPRIAETAVERARLTVVPRRSVQAPRVPFMILVALVLLGGVVGLLLFNTHMQQASFAATSMESRAASLHAREQQLRMELDKLRDPQRVAQKAESLGMVPLVNPAFIRLADGTVLGDALPAKGEDRQRLTPLPPKMPASFRPDPVVVPPTDVAAADAAATASGDAKSTADGEATTGATGDAGTKSKQR